MDICKIFATQDDFLYVAGSRDTYIPGCTASYEWDGDGDIEGVHALHVATARVSIIRQAYVLSQQGWIDRPKEPHRDIFVITFNNRHGDCKIHTGQQMS